MEYTDVTTLDPGPSRYVYRYLKEEIRIICFTEITSEKLAKSGHDVRYGRLGLVFQDTFLLKHGLRPVYYYTEESLLTDMIVNRWNLDYAYRAKLSPEEEKVKRGLELEILTYRKPATLFRSFSESGSLVLMAQTAEYREAYDRYPDGYDFTTENEWRIVSENEEEYLYFDERDLRVIIIPGESYRDKVMDYLEQEWNNPPSVVAYPKLFEGMSF